MNLLALWRRANPFFIILIFCLCLWICFSTAIGKPNGVRSFFSLRAVLGVEVRRENSPVAIFINQIEKSNMARGVWMLLLFIKLEFCPWQKIALPQEHIEIGFYALPLEEGDLLSQRSRRNLPWSENWWMRGVSKLFIDFHLNDKAR